MCRTVMIKVIEYCKLFKDFNEKLKNSKYLECFFKERGLI